jgi:hypothetical protein
MNFIGNIWFMKFFPTFLLFLLTTCVKAEQVSYMGSTPANSPVVREFLGISHSDSIDFIRWTIVYRDDKFSLKCNYGIGKPNTNGFMEGGNWVQLDGVLRKQNHYYFLESKNKILGLLEINKNLLHLLNADNTLLVGNGGWSYTLSKEKGSALPADINFLSKKIILKDSMAFQGRTPCWDFPLVHPGPQCIKQKWLIILYTDPKTNQPTIYHLNGNSRGEGGIWGTWKIIIGKDGKVIYQLFSTTTATPLELLSLNENILVFIDSKAGLLIGNQDFSFTLSRKW